MVCGCFAPYIELYMEKNMNCELRPGEQVIKVGRANLQKNIETVGGWLCLTNQRLVFEAHKFNVQVGTTEVELSDVQSSQQCWTKFLGVIPVFPNSLAVHVREGNEHRFVLDDRASWATAIEAHLGR